MPRSFTVAQLRTRVRERTDTETARSLTDTELNSRLSASYGKYHAKLVKSGFSYAGEVTQTIVATGADSYPLDPGHAHTLRVDFQYDSQNWEPLDEIDVRELEDYQFTGSSQAYAYRLVGNNLVLYPTPSSGTYRHIYVAAPADLASDSQLVNGVTGWEEALVIDTAISVLQKGGDDVSVLLRDRDLIDARIDEEAQMRVLTQTHRIRIRRRRCRPGCICYWCMGRR